MVSVLAMSNVASAVSATIDEVKLDGDTLSPSSNNAVLDVDRDQELEVRVRFTATANQDNVQVEAAIRGYDHGDLIEDITDAFDVKTGNSYIKKLTLPLRERMDQGKYLLRVRIEDRAGATVTQTYTLDVDTERHNLQVYDVVLSPGETVNAGRALLAAVRVRNRGEKDEKNVKVTVSIPELGVSASDFIDEIEKSEDDDDETTSEELYLRIPDDAETGDYTLVTELQYDLGDEYETQEQVIRVVGSEKAMEEKKEKTILTVAADAQSLQAGGAEVAYPITLTNAGSTSKVYTVTADGASWATMRVSPGNVVVVGAGESKAVTVYVAAAKNAPAGEQSFTVTIMSDDKVLKQLALKANVSAESAASKLKRGLEVGLVVLVVLLVIVGLIIGFNKLKGGEEGGDEETYY
ncbi:hypothetical protein J4212_08590 [Candidatus Woesearchaeota archaeon]|nr:hypothetical protein [Candidatus Woesearchaeota archaeon]